MTDLFGSGYQPTTIGRATWLSLVPQSGIQANCNMEGFNVDVPMYAAARIGILANQENDCGSPDSYIGIGTSGTTCSGQEVSSGNKAACDPVLDVNGAQVGTQYHPTFGYVFIR